MNSCLATLAPVVCTLSQLVSYQSDLTEPETIFSQADSFHLQVAIEFSRSGAIALMPLALPLQIEFFAERLGNRDRFLLGNIVLYTVAGQRGYIAAIEVEPQVAGLAPEEVYRITALLKVGALGQPAWIVGTIDGLLVQTY